MRLCVCESPLKNAHRINFRCVWCVCVLAAAVAVLVTTKRDFLAKEWNQFRCRRRHLLSFQFEFILFRFLVKFFSLFFFFISNSLSLVLMRRLRGIAFSFISFSFGGTFVVHVNLFAMQPINVFVKVNRLLFDVRFCWKMVNSARV